ncbi:hypothetical protein [Sneathiella sp.]|uniref:hypothetical protein n=1 Tax=Sneathiella sp. TaxID=1964365 RepID=UPI002FE28F41
MDKQLAVRDTSAPSTDVIGNVFSSRSGFDLAQRMARALSESTMVPDAYRSNMGNALVAIDMAQRTGASALMVMQNLHVIEGRPSWSAPFIIAALNSCGRFSPLRFEVTDLGETEVEYDVWTGPKGARTKTTKKEKIRNKRYVASAKDKSGDLLEGPEVTLAMAVAEGWYGKSGSKWKTMPDLMGRYRAAAFFGRLYAPDVLMGIPMEDEVYDLPPTQYQVVEPEPAQKPAPKIVEPMQEDPAAGAEADKPKPSRGRPSKVQIEAAQKDGYRAFHAGVEKDDVPDDVPSVQAAWIEGWESAEADAEGEPATDNGDEPDVVDAEIVEDDAVPFDMDDGDDQSGFGFGD